MLPIPTVANSIALHEHAMSLIKNSRVVGIGINSIDLSKSDRAAAIETMQRETGLPTVDPLRQSPAPLVDALIAYFSSYNRADHSDNYVKVYDRLF